MLLLQSRLSQALGLLQPSRLWLCDCKHTQILPVTFSSLVRALGPGQASFIGLPPPSVHLCIVFFSVYSLTQLSLLTAVFVKTTFILAVDFRRSFREMASYSETLRGGGGGLRGRLSSSPRQLHESPLNHVQALNENALFIDLRSFKADFSMEERNDFLLKDLGCKFTDVKGIFPDPSTLLLRISFVSAAIFERYRDRLAAGVPWAACANSRFTAGLLAIPSLQFGSQRSRTVSPRKTSAAIFNSSVGSPAQSADMTVSSRMHITALCISPSLLLLASLSLILLRW